MRLRRALGVAVAGVGLASVTNRVLRSSAGVLEPALEGSTRTYRWRGIDVEYAVAGDADDPTLVLLHGVNAAGSSGEFRAVFDDLAEDFRVVAPDLPGFGRSERPPLRYSAALYEDFVEAFLAEFEDPHVVASSLTCAYVAAALTREGVDADVASLVCVCPTAAAGPDPPKAWLRELLRAPVVGPAVFNVLASRPSIDHFNADHGYYDPANVSEEWSDYEWRTAHQENARYAPASFVSGYLNADVDLADSLRSVDAPVTLVWGREAEVTPLSDGRTLAEEADAELVVFDASKLLPHVEFGRQFAETVRSATGV